ALTVPAGAITTAGNVSLTSGAALTTNGDISAHDITLGGAGVGIGDNLTATGNLAINSTGAVTQTAGTLLVTGTSALAAGSNAITLASVSNDFTGAVTATGGAVSLADANALAVHLTATSATLSAGGVLGVDGSTLANLSANGNG